MSISRRRAFSTPNSGVNALLNAASSIASRSPNPFVRGAGLAYRGYNIFRGLTTPKATPPAKKKVKFTRKPELSGQSKGRLVKRKMKYKKYSSKYGINGNIFRFEQNGSLFDAQTVYVGHAVGFNPFIHGLMRAVLATLFRLAKIPFGSWEGKPARNYRLKWNYRKEYDYSTLNIFDQNFTTAMAYNYKTMGDIMYDGRTTAPAIVGIKQQFAGTNISDNFSFYSVALMDSSDTPEQFLSIIYFDEWAIDWKVTSSLDIQNITVADWTDNTIAATSTGALANNIYANPLKGIVYSNRGKGNKWCNGFIDNNHAVLDWYPPKKPDTTSLQEGAVDAIQDFLGDQSGLIAQKGANLSYQTQKPVYPSRFEGKVKSSTCVLDPGHIKKSWWKFKGAMKWNNFLAKYGRRITAYFDTTAGRADNRWNFGFSEMVGLEKLLDTKGTGEKNRVQIGFEQNAVYCIKLRKVKTKSLAPFVWVQATNVSADIISDNTSANPNIDVSGTGLVPTI
jgi:hypothetical protein